MSASEDVIRIHTSINGNNLIVVTHPKAYLRLPLIKHELKQCSLPYKTYSNPNRAVKKVKQLIFEKLFLIRCRSIDYKTVSHYLSYELPKVDAAYTIDEETDNDDDITAVFGDLKENLLATGCCNSVSSSTESLRSEINAITINTYHPDSVSKGKMFFLWNQLMASVILNLAYPSKREIDETMSKFIKLHSNNVTAKRELISFQQHYNPTDAIRYYTTSSFMYTLLNQALQTRNVDAIFDLRFNITDLHHHLAVLYRGQSQARRSNKEKCCRYFNTPLHCGFDDFSRNVGGLISFNSLLSVSAVECAAEFPHDTDTKNDILVEIVNVDSNSDAAMPFANISEFSATGDIRETLFSWHSPFLVQSVEKSESSFSSVKLHLITKEKLRETLTELSQPFAGTLCDPERLLAHGRKFEEKNENQKAVAYYKKLFKILLSNNSNGIIDMYEQLDRLYKEFDPEIKFQLQFGGFIKAVNTIDYNQQEINDLIDA
ncbi:unnamed protein product [Rotaria socialis]|uniref:Uncharacterized protein n=1 Tax=Rotaria socialis TaxID=392032 RepID=A0A821P6X5_9BILA|nr:unnamed protein product [Rotaria socialis]CAF4798768.1 unnamed protein product [Rotaria socialis]